jgi:MYXO-CTERM domain-containing protein
MAVPEPVTWAFTLLGLGLAGAAPRRRSTLPAT